MTDCGSYMGIRGAAIWSAMMKRMFGGVDAVMGLPYKKNGSARRLRAKMGRLSLFQSAGALCGNTSTPRSTGRRLKTRATSKQPPPARASE